MWFRGEVVLVGAARSFDEWFGTVTVMSNELGLPQFRFDVQQINWRD